MHGVLFITLAASGSIDKTKFFRREFDVSCFGMGPLKAIFLNAAFVRSVITNNLFSEPRLRSLVNEHLLGY